MKYAVLTAKHPEGFCLFDSAYTDYKATNTPAGRDLVREYVDAFRAEGLRVGLYYSLVDWHHPDYPAYNDPFHPMRGTDVRREERCDFSRYLDYMHAQVRELCTNYGKLDLLWFDFSYDGHCGEDWRAGELVEMVRTLQPGILLNSRLEASGGSLGSLLSGAPALGGGFCHPLKQILPPAPLCRPDGTPGLLGGVSDHEQQLRVHGRGPVLQNGAHLHPPAGMRQGGNYLLNVGPDARGNPPQSRRILCEIGEWMRPERRQHLRMRRQRHSVAAFGCRATARGKNLYLHVMEQPLGRWRSQGFSPAAIRSARVLATGAEADILTSGWAVQNYPKLRFSAWQRRPTKRSPCRMKRIPSSI